MNLTIINRRGATSDLGLLMKKILIVVTTLVCLWSVQPAQANQKTCLDPQGGEAMCEVYCRPSGGVRSYISYSVQCPTNGERTGALCICNK
jgi:hypothetical protein